MNELPNHWLVFAREDLHVAEPVFDKGIFNQACFLARALIEWVTAEE